MALTGLSDLVSRPRVPRADDTEPHRGPLAIWWVRATVIYAASRVVALGAMGIAWMVTRLPFALLVIKWDSAWYMRIAFHGYPAGFSLLDRADQQRYAFLPLLPLIIHPFTLLSNGALIAAWFLCSVIGWAAALAVYRMVEVTMGDRYDEIGTERLATRTLILWSFFPGTMVLNLVYTEGLAALLLCLCLIFLQRRQWLAAGIIAALAGGTRPNGLALVAACAFAAYRAWQRGDHKAIIAPLLAPTGFLAYIIFVWARTGSPMTWDIVENKYWRQTLDFSLGTMRELTPAAIVHHVAIHDFEWMALVIGLITVLAGLALYRRHRLPGTITAVTAGVLLFCFTASRVGPRPRFLVLAIGLFILFAETLRPKAFWTVSGLFALGLGLMTYITMLGHIVP